MSQNRAISARRALTVVIVLLVAVAWPAQPQSASVPASPPPEALGQSFSITGSSPLTASGVHPADILGVGGLPVIPCLNLGLVCTDPVSGMHDELAGLSYGWDFHAAGLPPLQFSVATGSRGATGTAVRTEADCAPPEPQADAFGTWFDHSNQQILDGDGIPCGSNAGLGLGLTEAAASDNLNNLERDPCLYVDLDCDGVPEGPIFFTLAPGSPSLALAGATPADILVTSGFSAPTVWAAGGTALGLRLGDVIDALCIRDNGDGVYGSEDEVLFSLAPGSTTLVKLSASPADVLRPSPPRVVFTAAMLGLEPTDDVDGLLCAFQVSWRFFPWIRR